MAGLAVLIGEEATADAVVRMLEAAPHRGPVTEIYAETGMALGVQARRDAPSFARSALRVDADSAVATVGCLYDGESSTAADDAAERLAKACHGMSRPPRGAYVAVTVDRAHRRAAALRSAIGERPLFWRRAGRGRLALASEVKQVAAAPWPAPRPDTDSALALAALTFADVESTAYPDIRRVPSATRLTVAGDEVKRERTWDPEALVGRAATSVADARRELRRLLDRAVSRRLDARTALLLSGGIDSTAVAAAAAPMHRERFEGSLLAVSATYPDHPSADETGLIREVVEALVLRSIEVTPRPRPLRDLGAQLTLHDGPSVVAGAGSLEILLEAAHGAGCTAALDGTDGDSLFGLRGDVGPALLRRSALKPLAARLRRDAGGRLAGWPRAVRNQLIAPMAGPRVREAYREARRRPPITPEAPVWARPPLADRLASPPGIADPPGWRAKQAAIHRGPLEVLLEVLERIGLARGVTLLHPLADQDLVEFFLSLPPEIKFPTPRSKALVRESFPDLPLSVTARLEKPHFDDVAAAGAPPEDVRAALAECPQVLPGVDWDALALRGSNGAMSGTEVAMIVRVLQADRLVGAG
jgi:asparagine synthase (glutamine-hydrolysing)